MEWTNCMMLSKKEWSNTHAHSHSLIYSTKVTLTFSIWGTCGIFAVYSLPQKHFDFTPFNSRMHLPFCLKWQETFVRSIRYDVLNMFSRVNLALQSDTVKKAHFTFQRQSVNNLYFLFLGPLSTFFWLLWCKGQLPYFCFEIRSKHANAMPLH